MAENPMRAGFDRQTGRTLTGWDHCVQSIGVVLTTRVGARLMRRAFGSALKDLQDRNASATTIALVYAAVAGSLARWEPGFRLRTMLLDRSGRDGVFAFILEGDFYPRGHLGDFRTRDTKAAVIGFDAAGALAFARAAGAAA